MRTVLKFSLGFLMLASVSCEPTIQNAPFTEFVKAKKNGETRQMRVAGVFDLKSICLNFNPHYKPTGDFCQAYFSENARGGGVLSQEVSLRVCQNGVSTNCIDPLPENAPPEVIIIRDSDGDELKKWGRVVIDARISSADKLTGIEVLTIDGAN